MDERCCRIDVCEGVFDTWYACCWVHGSKSRLYSSPSRAWYAGLDELATDPGCGSARVDESNASLLPALASA